MLVSVLTPAFNAAAFIADAAASVIAQGRADIEHIVIDGASTDGTADRLPSSVRLIREPDRGLYDALNKGIAAARGRWIAWINADDLLAPGAVDAAMAAADDAEMIAGAMEFFEADGSLTRRTQFTAPADFARGRITQSAVLLNGCLFSADLLRRVGPFEFRWRGAGDLDYLIRLCRARPRMRRMDAVVCRFRRHGGRLTRTLADRHEESVDILLRHLAEAMPPGLRAWCLERLRKRGTSLMKRYARRGRLPSLARIVSRMTAADPAWPVWLAARPLARRS